MLWPSDDFRLCRTLPEAGASAGRRGRRYQGRGTRPLYVQRDEDQGLDDYHERRHEDGASLC